MATENVDGISSRPTYGRAAIHGAVWVVFASGAAQSLSLLSQLVLGYILLKADFGIYALALSFSNLVVVLRNGGMHRILVQRPKEFGDLAPRAFRIAICFNFVATGIIIGAAFPLAGFYSEPRLVWMLAAIAISLPLQSPTVVNRARLMIGLQYRSVSLLDALAAVVRYGSMIGFALLGMGPMSFVLPMPLVSIFEWFSFRWTARRSPPIPMESNGTQNTMQLLGDAKWVLFGSLTMALTLQGDKLVVGKLETLEFLGIYFFGHQLIMGLSRPLVGSLTQVLMPALSHLSDDPSRQAQAFLKIVGVTTLCCASVSFGVVVVAQPLIHLIWSGLWDASVPVLRVFACALPIVFLSAVATILLQSRGAWRDVAWIQAVQGILTAVAAYAGATTGSAAMTAFSVVSVGMSIAVVKTLRACYLLQLSPIRLLSQAIGSLLAPAICAIVSLTATSQAPNNQWLEILLSGSLYLGLLLLAACTVLRQSLKELYTYVRRRRS